MKIAENREKTLQNRRRGVLDRKWLQVAPGTPQNGAQDTARREKTRRRSPKSRPEAEKISGLFLRPGAKALQKHSNMTPRPPQDPRREKKGSPGTLKVELPCRRELDFHFITFFLLLGCSGAVLGVILGGPGLQAGKKGRESSVSTPPEAP